MNDRGWAFLESHKSIILPEELEHECYIVVQTACILYPNDWINLYCRGDGGGCRIANSIVDAVQTHGKVRGILAGEANSSHGIVFAGCPERYVYPNGALGVHRTVLHQIEMVDAPYARNRFEGLEAGDRSNARILASACPVGSELNAEWWYQQIAETGKGLRLFDSAFLISNGMAKPASDLKGVTDDD